MAWESALGGAAVGLLGQQIGQGGASAAAAAQEQQSAAAQAQLDFFKQLYANYQTQANPLESSQAALGLAASRGDLAAGPYGQMLEGINRDYGAAKGNISADLARRGIAGSGVAPNVMQNLELQKMGLVTGARTEALTRSQQIAQNILAGIRGKLSPALAGIQGGFNALGQSAITAGQNAWGGSAANMAALNLGAQTYGALDKWGGSSGKTWGGSSGKTWGNAPAPVAA